VLAVGYGRGHHGILAAREAAQVQAQITGVRLSCLA